MKQILKERSIFGGNLAAIIAVVVIGGIGSILVTASHAATPNHNPTGTMDYCDVENGATVVYGWAYDPDTTTAALPDVTVKVGATTLTALPSSITNYRVAAINASISKSYPGQPEGGAYGWRAVIGTVYKGAGYAVSGTVLNTGTGANVALPINIGPTLINGEPDFPGSKLPDSCAIAKPAPPAPTPTPTPTPKPTPTPTPTPTPKATTKKTTTTTTTTPASNTTPAPANTADATVTAGTVSVGLKIPADNANSVHIAYGTDASSLNASTSDQAVSSDTTIAINGLDAKTTYTYQIVRTNAGGTTNSTNATFTTKGYTLSIAFLDNKDNGVSGITGTLNDSSNSTATTDKDGTMTFSDLASGDYTVSFTYNGQQHSLTYDTSDSTTPSNNDTPVTLSDTVDVSQFTAGSVVHQTASKRSPVGVILAGIVFLIVIVGVVILLIRRRRAKQDAYEPLPGPTNNIGMPVPVNPQVVAPQALPNATPAHVSESLREMVIKSMHEQAVAKKKQGPPPTVPGQ